MVYIHGTFAGNKTNHTGIAYTKQSSSICCHECCFAVFQELFQFGCKIGVKNKMQEDIIQYNLYCAGIHTELGQPLFYRRKASLTKPVFLSP